ncbi:hypothetical protein F4778DRAFT_85388 [Xylariomycetidae sp. FL2044]|nr:hypothetical protein F4778DRAFT_85388 [Xylariomycetidae sp. FL2044]
MKYQLATAAATFVLGAVAEGLERRATSAAEQILQIAPKSASCAGAGEDCRTNVQVTPFLIDAMIQYNITNSAVIAAVLALTSFESDSYQYKVHIYPSKVPGQGTSNMQSAAFNRQYAESIPELKDQLAAITGDTDADKDAILKLVTDDKYNFGSGPWFITSQPECKEALDAFKKLYNPDDGVANANADDCFAMYMTCVGVTVTDERTAVWNLAKEAFGITA